MYPKLSALACTIAREASWVLHAPTGGGYGVRHPIIATYRLLWRLDEDIVTNDSSTSVLLAGLWLRTAEAGDAQFSPPHRTIPDNAVAASRMSPFVVHTLRDDMYP